MMPLFFAASLLVLAVPLILSIVRANELFFLRIRSGKVFVARGRIPQRLLDDMGDVVASVTRASLRGVVEGGRPRLYATGELDANQRQRLRNLIGAWSTAQIRTAPRRRR
ncbi:MAG TPA: DUF3634 family protein [Polyangiaceae bacterium]|nr:DUF3634 family protein [Polyangiaceae bacterium]